MSKAFALAVLGALILSQAGITVVRADDAEKLAALRKEKAFVAEQRWQALMQFIKRDENFGYRLYDVSIAWKDVSMAIATTKAQEIAALEAHRDRIRHDLRKVEALYLEGARGGETEKYQSGRSWLLEAESWILEAKR